MYIVANILNDSVCVLVKPLTGFIAGMAVPCWSFNELTEETLIFRNEEEAKQMTERLQAGAKVVPVSEAIEEFIRYRGGSIQQEINCLKQIKQTYDRDTLPENQGVS